MSAASVDVVIPTVGRDTLRQAVESASTEPETREILVVLDAPDREPEVRRSLAGLPHRLICTAGSLGGAAARNAGVAAAEAPFVAFLDDDDYWVPGKLGRQLAGIDAPVAERVLAASAFHFLLPNGARRVVPASPPPSSARELASYLVARDRLRFGRNALQSSSVLVARGLAREVGWDARLRKHQDWDFALRAIAAGAVLSYTPEPLVHVRKGTPSSISVSRRPRDSLQFYERHRADISPRSRADFLWMHVMRGVASRADALEFLRSHGKDAAVPHLSALSIGASGAVGGLLHGRNR
jgi:glycosyltransferase involved in cell wall biosynthesis